jgi:FAD/FMN-containing dehydrogenase
MPTEWTNWSGSLCFTPNTIAVPADEDELVAIVRHAALAGRTVRVVGAGHSSTPLVETSDLLVSLEQFSGVLEHNTAARTATVGAGTRLHALGKQLHAVELALENLGDVDVQAIAGAIGTGIHGSGKTLKILSSQLVGLRMVTASGELVEWTEQEQPEELRAARVALGTLGIFTTVTLQLQPAFQLHRREWCAHVEDALDHLEQLVEQNRNFDFYWYPRSDEAKLRTMNSPEARQPDLAFARLLDEQAGWSHEIIPKQRTLRFDEMEYALPADAGPACFRDIRQRVKAKWRRSVGWRLLYRTSAADDSFLSTNYERSSVTISLHQNNSLPYQAYFADLEPILRAYGGRPHWGKKHTLLAAELRPLYPCWEQFQHIRQRLDPQGLLLNTYLRDLFGIDQEALR